MTKSEALSLLSLETEENAGDLIQQKLFEHKHKLLQGPFSSPILGISLRKIEQLAQIEHALNLNTSVSANDPLTQIDLKQAPLEVWKCIQIEISSRKMGIMQSSTVTELSAEVVKYKILAEQYEVWLSAVLSQHNLKLPVESVPARNVIDPMYLNAALEELYGPNSKDLKIDAKFEENHKELLLELKRVKDINAKFHLA